MVQLMTEAGKVELDKEEQPHLVTWVQNRYCFIAELVGEKIELCVFDKRSGREFEHRTLPPAVAVERWHSWFKILSDDS